MLLTAKIYEGADHDLLSDFADVRAEMDRWSDRYVRDRTSPSINGLARLPPEVMGAKRSTSRPSA